MDEPRRRTQQEENAGMKGDEMRGDERSLNEMR